MFISLAIPTYLVGNSFFMSEFPNINIVAHLILTMFKSQDTFSVFAGEGAGQSGKKAKVETSMSEDEIRASVKNGTLGKLTVPVLKQLCQNYGLKGGKKQELVDALVGYFNKK